MDRHMLEPSANMNDLDLYAAFALSGLLAALADAGPDESKHPTQRAEWYAKQSYDLAEAMVREARTRNPA